MFDRTEVVYDRLGKLFDGTPPGLVGHSPAVEGFEQVLERARLGLEGSPSVVGRLDFVVDSIDSVHDRELGGPAQPLDRPAWVIDVFV